MPKRSEVYGYWIGEDEIYEAGYEDHHGKGIEILDTVHGITEEGYFGYKSVCIHLFALGYVRVINHSYDDGHDVEYREDVPHSKLQKEFIKDASRVDIVNEHRSTISVKYNETVDA